MANPSPAPDKLLVHDTQTVALICCSNQVNVHKVLVSECFHANRAFTLARLQTIVDAFFTHDVAADSDDGIFEAAIAVAVCDLLSTC